MPRLLVLSGLPASGKSTLGTKLADHLNLPFFDKDHFLERLFTDSVKVSPATRAKLSRQADVEFEAAVRSAERAVLASWWRHPKASSSSGTVPWWLQEKNDVFVEIHCVCSPDTAVVRFMGRTRHAGHNDKRWSYAELLATFVRQAALGPLHSSRAIVFNTENATTASRLTHLAETIC